MRNEALDSTNHGPDMSGEHWAQMLREGDFRGRAKQLMRAKQKVRKCAPEELSEIKETLELYVSYQTRGRWRLRKLGYM